MRYELVLPDLGLGEQEIIVSLWLVRAGSEVSLGDRLIEVLADGVTVDLPAPAGGVVVKMLVAEEEPIRVGQTLGIIESPPDDSPA
jgi:pyruvate/2-oxoglutarate dehydrogenase complex dihydrolipoamide acyltransferase (E2) component